MRARRSRRAICVLALLLLLTLVLSFPIGRFDVPLLQAVKILASRVAPVAPTWTAQMEAVILRIRLPRILMACLVGASLAAAGAAYQGVFQNPMASPDILGASTGAAFGAAAAILWGGSAGWIMLAAFLSSVCAVLFAYLIALRAPGTRVTNLILAGIMLGTLLSAGTSLIKLAADPSSQLPQITYWLMGSLSDVKQRDLLRAFVPMAAGLAPLYLLRWRLNLLAMGDESAHALGANVNLLRLGVILCATLITAASVAVSGVIGWVGLVIPHLCRRLVGGNYQYLLPASALAGAAFLLAADGVARSLLAVEIPIGILTSFIGAPFFLALLLKRRMM
jgi:iron complex transport system permease protein